MAGVLAASFAPQAAAQIADARLHRLLHGEIALAKSRDSRPPRPCELHEEAGAHARVAWRRPTRSPPTMAFANALRTRAHSFSSAWPPARVPEGTAGGLPFSAVDSAMASVQWSHWLSRSESDCRDSVTSTSVRRASRRMSVGPLRAVRCGACTIPPESKSPLVYTSAGWGRPYLEFVAGEWGISTCRTRCLRCPDSGCDFRRTRAWNLAVEARIACESAIGVSCQCGHCPGVCAFVR